MYKSICRILSLVVFSISVFYIVFLDSRQSVAKNATTTLVLKTISLQNIEFLDLLRTLNTTKNTTIYIYFDSGGGRMDAAYTLMHAIKYNKNKVVCVLNKKAYSAAAMIFMSCPIKIIHNESSIMFHMIRTRDGFTGQLTKIDDKQRQYYMQVFVRYNIFTQMQLFQIYNYEDVYMSGSLLRYRIIHGLQ